MNYEYGFPVPSDPAAYIPQRSPFASDAHAPQDLQICHTDGQADLQFIDQTLDFIHQPASPPLSMAVRQRTARACVKCRERHAKCSGEKPQCERCISRGLVCIYTEPESRTRPRGSRERQGHLTESRSLDELRNSQRHNHYPIPSAAMTPEIVDTGHRSASSALQEHGGVRRVQSHPSLDVGVPAPLSLGPRPIIPFEAGPRMRTVYDDGSMDWIWDDKRNMHLDPQYSAPLPQFDPSLPVSTGVMYTPPNSQNWVHGTGVMCPTPRTPISLDRFMFDMQSGEFCGTSNIE